MVDSHVMSQDTMYYENYLILNITGVESEVLTSISSLEAEY